MLIKRIQPTTKIYGAPADWIDDGTTCVGLPVYEHVDEQGLWNVSAWEPTPAELELLNEGGSIRLWVRGPGHPVVAMTVEPVQE